MMVQLPWTGQPVKSARSWALQIVAASARLGATLNQAEQSCCEKGRLNHCSHPGSYGAVMHSARVIVQSQAGLGYSTNDAGGVAP